MQAPREKGSLSCSMIVWQSAATEGIHEKKVGVRQRDSHESRKADCQSAAG